MQMTGEDQDEVSFATGLGITDPHKTSFIGGLLLGRPRTLQAIGIAVEHKSRVSHVPWYTCGLTAAEPYSASRNSIPVSI